MKIIYFVLLFSGYLLACFYVALRGWSILPAVGWVKVIYIISMIYLQFGYMVCMVFYKHLPLWIGKGMECVGSTWLIAMIYFLIAVLIIDVVRLLNHWFPFLPSFELITTLRFRQYVALLILTAIGLLFWAGYYRFIRPKVVEIEIAVKEKLDNLSDTHLTIVFASDLHLGSLLGLKSAQRFVDLINGENPDLILLGGDVVNADIKYLQQQCIQETLQQLHAPLGIFAVLGNHEYIGSGPKASATFLESGGICVLRDSVVEIKDVYGKAILLIIGRDDRINRNRRSLCDLYAELPQHNSLPVILLDHQPYQLDEVVEQRITLMLSGHTHQGQVWPISWMVTRMYELSHGLRQKEESSFYVSSGLGIWGPPFRIGTQSEVVVIRFKAKNGME